MNMGINNTAFKGHIIFKDITGKRREIDTKDIKAIGAADKYELYIQTKKDSYAPDGVKKAIEETYNIPASDLQKGYDRIMKIYDIASRNNVSIAYLNT